MNVKFVVHYSEYFITNYGKPPFDSEFAHNTTNDRYGYHAVSAIENIGVGE